MKHIKLQASAAAAPGGLLWLERFSSVRLSLFCLGLSMMLVLLGTLAQVNMGTFAAQKEFFNTWWVMGRLGDLRIPTFPGGLTVGSLWMVNLLAAFATRFKYRRRDAGILISHFGIILLMMGQLITQTRARESNLPLEIGQTKNYSESFRDTELAILMTSDPQTDELTHIPLRLFSREGRLDPPGLPFSLVIRRFIQNAQLGMSGPDSPPSLATQGIGTRIAAQELPPVSSDEEINTITAYVEVLTPERSLGTWLISSGLGAPQPFTVAGKDYQMHIRPRRFYYPFRLTLREFHHDIYPGTDIPKNFSSLVHLENPEKKESRDALIYMNHPLRYDGNTFYQASFGKGDQLSVFQVVKNPASWAPYISCLVVILGLLIQFLSHLFEFIRKRPSPNGPASAAGRA